MIQKLAIEHDKNKTYKNLLTESNNKLEELLNEIKEHNRGLFSALMKNKVKVWSHTAASIKNGKIVFKETDVF